MQHVDAPQLMAAYALDVLPEAENRPLEAHIRTCVDCQRDLAGLLSAVHALPLSLEPMAPPVALRARLLASANQAQSGRRQRLRQRGRTRVLERRIGGWLASAALFLAALGLGGWGLAQHEQLGANVPIALATTVSGASAMGVYGQAVGNVPAISVSRLPAPPNGMVYEAWVVHSGVPRPAGIFVTSSDGNGGVVLTTAPMPGDLLDVTLEPAPGDLTPTGPEILKGRTRV